MKVCINIIPDGQGGYRAVCPALPGCSTKAQTRQQAQERIREMIKGYLAAVSDFVPEHLEPELLET
jgi:predicted RNase H-like HicB family nuclease